MQKSICFRDEECKMLLKANGEEKSKDRFGCAYGQMRRTSNTIRKLPMECKAKHLKYERR